MGYAPSNNAALNAAHKSYGRVQSSAMTGRTPEAEAFARAAAMLNRARQRPHDFNLLKDALAFNQKLWTIMEAELSDPAHPAPGGVKQDMLALARFMDQAAAHALKAERPRLDAMIDVNASLSKGLYGR